MEKFFKIIVAIVITWLLFSYVEIIVKNGTNEPKYSKSNIIVQSIYKMEGSICND